MPRHVTEEWRLVFDMARRIQGKTSSAIASRGADLLLPVSMAQVWAVEIVARGKLTRFERDAAGTWFRHIDQHTHAAGGDVHVADPIQAPIIDAAFRGFDAAVAEARVAPADAPHLAQYGLALPTLIVLFYARDSSTPLARLEFGTLADRLDRYARLAPDGAVSHRCGVRAQAPDRAPQGRRSRLVRLRRVLLAAVIALGAMVAAQAHQINLSIARVTFGGDRSVSVEIGLKGSDADRIAGTRIFDAQRDQVDPALVAASAAPIIAYIAAHVAMTGADGKACTPGTAVLVADGDGVIFRNRFSCRDVDGDIVYRSTVLTDTDAAARQVVLIGEGDNAPQALLDTANTAVTLSAPAPSLIATLERYLLLGIEHIFLGYDHIAFLVAVVLWARRLVPLVKIVTAFTIAHSITLSLATLNVVAIPSTVVEPAIAASIVYVAMENFFTRNIDSRWRVTFAFGLIHGFGFAGALREIGLPTNAVAAALAAFNFGVEIGQVAIVSIVVPVLIALDRLMAVDRTKPARAATLVYALSALITVLGSYWFLTRVLDA